MFQSLLDSGGLSASAIKKLCGESMHVMSIGIWLIYCLSCLEVLTEDELRVAGVIASRAVGRRVAGSPEMCPLGLIVVLNWSVEEWVVHPQLLRDRGDPVPLRDAADVPRADAAGLADADAADARRAR